MRSRLAALDQSERHDALETLVAGEFKASLLMTADDELPADGSFFDLGLTSLRLTEVKERLEQQLGCAINATVLFNQPTLDQLMSYLTTDVLADLFPVTQPDAGPAGPRTPDAKVLGLLGELYRS